MDKKKCKYCVMMIPKEAKICPHCRKRQGWTLPAKIGLGIIIITVLFGAIPEFLSPSPSPKYTKEQKKVAQDLELDAGSLRSFNLVSKVRRLEGNFYYHLHFHDHSVINNVHFFLNEKQLKELSNLIDKAEKMIEKLRASDIKEITVEIGSLKVEGNTLKVSVMKELNVNLETSMCFHSWDRHGLNRVSIYRRGDKEIQELRMHIQHLRSKMSELKSISSKLKL